MAAEEECKKKVKWSVPELMELRIGSGSGQAVPCQSGSAADPCISGATAEMGCNNGPLATDSCDVGGSGTSQGR